MTCGLRQGNRGMISKDISMVYRPEAARNHAKICGQEAMVGNKNLRKELVPKGGLDSVIAFRRFTKRI